jgi:hypothetical protein
MYEKEDDSYDKLDFQNKIDESTIDRNNQNRKNMPAKKFLSKLEDFLNELKIDLAENKKDGQILRSENITLEHKGKESCNSAVRNIMEDLFLFEKEFKKTVENDTNETLTYKTNVYNLTMDKIYIDKNRIALDVRLRELENDLGYDNN